jgi:hypothetical protein
MDPPDFAGKREGLFLIGRLVELADAKEHIA